MHLIWWCLQSSGWKGSSNSTKHLNGEPGAAESRFDVSLDGPSMLWFMWEYNLKEPYVPFAVPAVGESVEIAGVPWKGQCP